MTREPPLVTPAEQRPSPFREQALEQLPVPLVSLPWLDIKHLPSLPLIASQVGHVVALDLDLHAALRERLDPSATLPEGRTREAVMDAEPWTYQVMAKEMLREGRLEAMPDPATPEVSDQRNYLYVELDKTTSYPSPRAPGTAVGTALAVKLRGDDRWYASHHDQPTWSIDRDGPAATTIELPPGSAPRDVEAIKALAVPIAATGTPPAPAPTDWRIELKALQRGFMLGAGYLPGTSFVHWRGSSLLTPGTPEVVVWRAD